MSSAAGAFMTLAVSRCPAMSGQIGDNSPTYAAITPPAIVANPPTITVFNSEMVMLPTKGLMSNGASVWPTKMLPVADKVSAPEVPRTRCITQAKLRTTHCMMPR